MKKENCKNELIFYNDNGNKALIIGPSNNILRRHGCPMRHTKRYPHERKWLTKKARVKYHTMKRVGCDDLLIFKNMSEIYGPFLADLIVYGKKGRYK